MKNKNTSSTTVPLAERLRPKALEEFLGQEKIFGEGSFLREALAADQVPSLIFWGPPGSGKTTLALLIAERTAADFFQLSAVGSGVKELRRIIETAEENRKIGKRTILFIDEIHRWNKAQQDALLPHVERGTLTLIGATTENPSFEVNGALLSRTRVLVLDKHGSEALVRLMERALAEAEKYFGKKVAASKEALEFIASVSGGDARQALGTLEACALHAVKEGHIDPKLVEQVVKRSHILYDKGGEEPLYVARRLVRFASEDVGLANSFALPQAVAAFQACQFLGMPECEVHLAQAVVYLASSKKSNALYVGYNQAKEDVRKYPNEPVPLHIRNAPTKLMKEIGYGKDYKYTPDYESEEEAAQEYFPEKLKGRKYINLETHQ